MRVCTRISDGYILEAQSNDEASMDALIANVTGYAKGELEFKVMADADVDAQILAQNLAEIPKPLDRLQLVIDYIAAKPDASAEMISIASEAVQTQIQQTPLLKG